MRNDKARHHIARVLNLPSPRPPGGHMTKPMLVALCLTMSAVSTAIAQKRCVKGIPCGVSCISASKTCRIGAGSTTTQKLPKVVPPTRSTTVESKATPAVPVGALYVASKRGQVFYWIGCDAWKDLAASNLIYFKSPEEARAAGYRSSATRGCTGPPNQEQAATDRGSTPRVTAGYISTACTVERVIDGDTFDCKDGNRVRLLLVNAPEMDGGVYGPIAKVKLEELLPRGTIVELEVDVEKRDRFGRVLAHVYTGGPVRSVQTFVNLEMVRSGMAVFAFYPPNLKYAEQAREAAKSAKQARVGLWATSAFNCPDNPRAEACK